MENNINQYKIRTIIIYTLFIAVMTIIMIRLFVLTVFPEVKPENINRTNNTQIIRGNIYDRNGSLLAISKRVYNVAVNPDRIKNKNDLTMKDINNMSKTLSKILNIDDIAIREKILSDTKFQYIKKSVDESVKEQIEGLKYTGIVFEPTFKREYPTKNLTSHIIGFVGIDNNGLEAIEKQYDDDLMGRNKDYNENKEYYFGNNLYLTIDKRIQEIVRDNLLAGIQKYEAKGAVGIVFNPMSSEILAMSSLPDYDPYKREATPFSAIVEIVEPGSVFKVFISSLLLGNGIVDRKTQTNCGEAITIGGRTIYANTRHDMLSFEDIIKYSSNVGMIKNSIKLSDELFYDGISDFGFGNKTGIDYPIESAGLFKPQDKKGSQLSKAMISIGYEISVTPLQLVTALGSFVNGGALTKPLLVSEIRDYEGKVLKHFTPVVTGLTPAKDKYVSSEVIDMMRGVVQRNGTGHHANIKGIDIVGKTGTAQRLNPNGSGYLEGRVNTTFFGVVKFLKDPIVILVLIYDPLKEEWASKASAPVFKNIVSDLIDRGLIFEY